MSDLISREEAIERLEILRRFNAEEAMQIAIDAAEQQINSCTPVFDKEKVISNLREELEFAEIEKERCIAENPSQFQSVKGYVNGVSFSLETVENGGVE